MIRRISRLLGWIKCPVCGGSGTYSNEAGKTVECRACGGAGEIFER